MVLIQRVSSIHRLQSLIVCPYAALTPRRIARRRILRSELVVVLGYASANRRTGDFVGLAPHGKTVARSMNDGFLVCMVFNIIPKYATVDPV